MRDDELLNTTASPLVKGLCIVPAIAAIASLIYLLLDFVSALERGPLFVGFLVLIIVLGIGLAAVFGLVWIRRSRGPAAVKKVIIALVLVGIILGAYFAIDWVRKGREYEKIVVGGIERQYRIHIPDSYTGDANAPVPLLLALHGGSGNAHQFERQSGFDAVSDAEGFIVVYPDGTGPLRYSFHIWNSGHIEAGKIFALEDDVAFLVALVNHLKDTYAIDTTRVYIAGHSNGAMMTYRMAGERADLFAAVAPVSGTIGGQVNATAEPYTLPEPSQPVSVVHVHGKRDINVKYDGGTPESGFQAGERVDKSVAESIGFWVAQDNCSEVPGTETSEDGKINLSKYTGGNNGSEVVLVSLAEENHFWENIDGAVHAAQFHGSTLAEMIWNLIKDYHQ